MPQFCFLPRTLAEKYVPPENSAIISFYDATEGPASLLGRWADVLRIEANDVDVARPGQILFSEAHAHQILDFLEKNRTCQEIVIHCTMGQSRSAAVALFASEHYDEPCFKVSMPVTWSSWSCYNKHIYRTLRNAAQDLAALKPQLSYEALFAQLKA